MQTKIDTWITIRILVYVTVLLLHQSWLKGQTPSVSHQGTA